MFNFIVGSQKKVRPESVVVLDFGTQSVKAAVLDLKGFRPTLLGLGEEVYKDGTILSGLVSDLDDFLLTVKNAVRQSSAASGFTPKHFVYSLSGEFIKTFSVDLKIQRENPGPVSSLEKEKISKEIDRLLWHEAELEFRRITGDPRPDFKIVEKRILNLETASGIGLESLAAAREKDLVATVLISFISSQTDKLLNRVTNDFKRQLFAQVSQMSGLVSLLLKSWGNFSAILVDFGGQVTDISLVLNGRIMGSRTIPLGGKDVTLELAKKLNLSEAEAEEKKISGEFEGEEIKEFLTFWSQSLDLAVRDISQNTPVPAKARYLFGRSSFLANLWDGQSGISFKEIDPKAIKDHLTLGGEKLEGFEALLATGVQVLENYGSDQF